MEITRRVLPQLPCFVDLYSDLHIGSADTDYRLLKRELQDSVNAGAVIAINGDVMDLILPGDRKRYKPESLHHSIRGRSDVVNATVDMAAELLQVCCHNILMIGEGNHESATEKCNSVNATKLLIEKIGGNINYGGYSGFLDFRVKGVSKSHRYLIFYHHGAGRGGAKQYLDKMVRMAEADLFWVGHRHDRVIDGAGRFVCPVGGDDVRIRSMRFAMSGSYTRTNGRGVLPYGVEKMLPPQDTGRVRVMLSEKNHSINVELRA